MKKRILSMLLALTMLVGIMPISALPAFAANKTEVEQIETRISAEHVPYAGREYSDLYTHIDSTIYSSAQASGSDWVDDAGVTIEIKGDGDFGEWYDIRYQFEAGRSYTAEYTYMINPAYEETHMFTESTTVMLTNPDPSKCTITGVVTDVRDSGRIVDVRYTMTIVGERSYPDIEAATLQKIAAPADGVQAEATALMYSNCTLTSQSWSPNVGTFEAGNTYTLTVNLHAKDGYKFADDFAPVLGIEGYEKAASSVELLNNNKDAVVSFTYDVGNYTIIDTLELEPISDAANFLPVAGESARYFPDLFEPVDGAPYEKEWLSSRHWYNEDDKTHMEQGDVFEAGKTYSYHSIFKIKTENEGTHRFASPTVQIENFIYQNDVQTEVGDDPLRIYVTFYYTCKFPAGAGSSAGNPAYCYSYEEFKYAMENENIRYVALANVNETLPVGEVGLVTAIQVKGIKNLQLLGDATFTAPAMTETTYAALLHTTYNTTLNISGAGSLTFKAVANSSFNAVIYNQGGSVNISEGTLIGSYNTAVYGKAIWQEYGDLRISDGQFFAENALAPGNLPNSHSAVYMNGGQAWIQGGTFRMRNWITTIDQPYGLQIGKDATVDLSGGTFYGILLPKSSTPLANYMDEELYTPLSDGSWFNPASEYSQGYVESGKVVRIAWLIDHVDVHINAPIAGVEITENYFNIPTSGCRAAMYYPQWYKNGEPVPYGTFEAGASYKVVMRVEPKPGYGIEFTSDITAALNNRNVALDSHGKHYVEFEYDFGVCPNVVPEVALTVTAPKEGNTPSGVIRGKNTYSVNDTQWMVSNTGADGTWTEMSNGTKFVPGKYYKIAVDLKAANGYLFQTNDSLDPDVTATVNGYNAKVYRVYEQSADEFICVEYNFGVCNKTNIESVIIENVVAPVVGEYPTYSCSYVGTGYGYYTDMDNGTFTKNGICWYDVTSGSDVIVWDNDTFKAGHTYKLQVTARVQDGFNFANTVFSTVNGDGNVTTSVNNGIWCTANYIFTCQPKTIQTVSVTELDTPVDGAHPDFTALTDSEYYTVESILWLDYENNMEEMTDEDTFVVGNRYYLQLTVVPTKTGSANNAKFVSGKTTAKLNGITVQKIAGDSWQEVSVNSKSVTIFYTFENTPYADGPFSVSGEVISYDGTVDGTVIELVPYGESTPAYTATLTSGGSYSFPEVNAGIYLIFFKKDGYVTREFIISVHSNVTQNSVMMRDYSYLAGDLDGNGAVTSADAIYLLYYTLFGEGRYPVNQPVDFDKNGTVNSADAIYLLYHTLFGEGRYPLS